MEPKIIRTQVSKYTIRVLSKSYNLSQALDNSKSYLLRVGRETDEYLLYELFLENRFKGHLKDNRKEKIELIFSFELPSNHKKKGYTRNDKVLGMILDNIAYMNVKTSATTIMELQNVGPYIGAERALSFYQIEEAELSRDSLIKSIQRDLKKNQLSRSMMTEIWKA